MTEYGLSGNSFQVKELNETIKQVAKSDISVLITGESGTGKEIAANAIHHYSRRKSKALVKVNCGAIPEGIIESELFGHEKGAFTGAVDTRKGYFELADGGTIFLDEIGEMPLATQVKILRVLETGEFLRVGGEKTISVDVRIIAATNRNLAREVENRNFREDLYFRLKSINLQIPPLRERKSDIKILFDSFVLNFCTANNISYKGIDAEAMDFIENYVWYGNARELKNFAESIIVLNPDKVITLQDVKKHLQPENISRLPVTALATTTSKPPVQPDRDFILRALFELKTDLLDLKNIVLKMRQDNNKSAYDVDSDFYIPKEVMRTMTFEDIDKSALEYILKIYKWDINKIAEVTGRTKRNIYGKIKQYDIRKD